LATQFISRVRNDLIRGYVIVRISPGSMPLHYACGIQKVLLHRISIPSQGILRRKLWLHSTALESKAYSTSRPTDAYPQNAPGGSEQSPQSLSKLVRKAMRGLPHPAMVITATMPGNGLVGLLVSSFNTVTLHPEPLVSFNIKLPSSTYDRVAETGEFTATSIWSVETANKYTKPLSHRNMIKDLDHSGLIQGALFSFRCTWLKEKSIEVGDHVIMVGRVIGYKHIQTPPQEAPEVPLLYCHGRYWKAPQVID